MERLRGLGNNKFLRSGLPLLGLVMGGTWGISFLLGERIRIRDASMQVDEERLPAARHKANQFSIDDELQRLREHINLNSYENKPVPRPEGWEEYVLPGQDDQDT